MSYFTLRHYQAGEPTSPFKNDEVRMTPKFLSEQTGIREECFYPFDQGYETPTPSEIRALFQFLKKIYGDDAISGAKIGAIIGKGGNRVREYQTEPDKKSHRPIQYDTWRCILLEFSLVKSI